MDNLVFAGGSGVAVLVLYAVLMLVIGWLAGRKHVERTNQSYYLAGNGLGLVTLFFTLYATQYSGNTIIGYAPNAYRMGFAWWQSVPFMMAVIGAYLIYAPRLYVVARKEQFVTPADWLRHRFHSNAVVLVAVGLMLWGLANYLLEQFVAMGHAISGLTGNTVPYEVGVLVFVIVMLIYSWSGGMRAVAVTDAVQGVMLLLGIAAMLVGVLYLTGSNLSDVTSHLQETDPAKIGAPDLETSLNWFSLVVVVGFGAAMYPHAIQRIYAAKSERTLKRSLAAMSWMPLVTTGVIFVVGILGLQLVPGLSEKKSEQLVGILANRVADINTFFFVLMVLFFGGIVAAIVSTADSALLSLSSVISRDVYGRFINPDSPESRQVLVGKVVGVIAVFALLMLAWNPPGTLYSIFVLKMELISQIAPAFMLGLYWRRLSAWPVVVGMIAGAGLSGWMTIASVDGVGGLSGGLLGLALNTTICVVGSLIVPHRDEQKDPESDTSRYVTAEALAAPNHRGGRS
ncbi:sodium:solute symporter family protein [Demetria terragena]|uniref:sodium:solute symporter family protein n=1 Tax=Demetria terragena TaxID=63959 RepID=UPI000371B571|nr:sodium:solute symporter family protein [Demetria terragena]